MRTQNVRNGVVVRKLEPIKLQTKRYGVAEAVYHALKRSKAVSPRFVLQGV